MSLKSAAFMLASLVFGSASGEGRESMFVSDDQVGGSSSSALALSFPLHRLEPYCTCVWLDPLVIASGPDLPPMQALPTTEDDVIIHAAAKAPVGMAHAAPEPSAATVSAAYVLASEPVETDRQNVADAHDGARVLFANPEAKNADKLLSGDTFSFMRNDCSADKWVVIELSQRVKLTTIDISMLELYSSRVKTFDVYGSLKKPSKAVTTPWNDDLWTHIATMRLENKKGQQAFHLQAPMFSKYLLLHFTAHFGSEPVCAINNFHAFGITEAEDLEEQLSALQESEAIGTIAHAAGSDALEIVANDRQRSTQAGRDGIEGAQSPPSAVHGGAADSVNDHRSDEPHAVVGANHVAQAIDEARHASDNGTNDGVEPVGNSDGPVHLQDRPAGDSFHSLQAALQSGSHPLSATPAASTEVSKQAGDTGGASAPSTTEQQGKNVMEGKASQVPASGAPQVLPHVFNEAVGVAVHGVGVPPAVATVARGGHGLGRVSVAEHARVAPAPAAGSVQAGTDVQPRVDTATSSVGQTRQQSKQTMPPWESETVAKARDGQPFAVEDTAVSDSTVFHDDDMDTSIHAHTKQPTRHGGSQAQHEDIIAPGDASRDARNPGRDSKRHATGPHSDMVVPSKGGSASVYDLIKKELLALKLETSTLTMSMKQAAPQASLQEAVRKHAETEAKLAFVMETLLALQTRLDTFSASKKEEDAMQVLQLQAACGVMALAMVIVLALGLCIISAQVQGLKGVVRNEVGGVRDAGHLIGHPEGATVAGPQGHEGMHEPGHLHAREGKPRLRFRSDMCPQEHSTSNPHPPGTTLSAGNSP